MCDGVADCADCSDEESCIQIAFINLSPISRTEPKVYTKCPDGWSLCNVLDQFCFPNHKICVFERDRYGTLHCPNTEHLRFCERHLCPTMFKCKASYCIATFMVCDGTPDCPGGEDEQDCNSILCPGTSS